VTDAAEYRRESRKRWGAVASGWAARAEAMSRASMPVSVWMVDALALQPGHDVLELAAGTGEVGFLAAEQIVPGGTLISSDWAPEMITVAQARAEKLGITNVRFRQIDAEGIDQEAASLDGVLCRWGYMLIDDPESALRDTRRVLKQDAAVALAAWTSADENPWTSIPVRLLVARGAMEPTPPGPGQFFWADPELIVDTMESAGFVQPELQRIEFARRYDSIDDWWVATTKMNVGAGIADEGLDFATRSDILADLEAAAQPFLRDDESLVVPAATWVATATA
jgi:SAM-dependent methyltransferase